MPDGVPPEGLCNHSLLAPGIMRLSLPTVSILPASSLGRAQADSPEHETVQQLVAQVKELQQRVKVLESRQRGGAVPEPVHDGETTTPAHTARTNQPEFNPWLRAAWHSVARFRGSQLQSTVREASGARRDGLFGSAGGFYTGALKIAAHFEMTGKANVLSEIVFQELDAQAFRTDLQRLLFNYDFNDDFKVSVGSYHTAIGYYNTAFHSGTWLQTTADRPLIMEFAADGGFLPTQAVGDRRRGRYRPAPGIELHRGYGSSDTIRPELNGTATDDENNGNHINLGLFARPGARSGLQIGGSLYHDRISDFRLGPSVRLGQTIANLHLVYVRHGVELPMRDSWCGTPMRRVPSFTTCPPSTLKYRNASVRSAPSYGINTSTPTLAVSFRTFLFATGPPSAPAMTSTTMSPSRPSWITPCAKVSRTSTAFTFSSPSLFDSCHSRCEVRYLIAAGLAVTYLLPLARWDVAVVVNENLVANLSLVGRDTLRRREAYMARRHPHQASGARSRSSRTRSASEVPWHVGARVQAVLGRPGVLPWIRHEEPLALPSNGMQKEALAIYPGAVCLMDAPDVKQGMKVVRVDGRIPGETGYPMHLSY